VFLFCFSKKSDIFARDFLNNLYVVFVYGSMLAIKIKYSPRFGLINTIVLVMSDIFLERERERERD
jgi:hypothetical protein